jgi:hypothetical protein
VPDAPAIESPAGIQRSGGGYFGLSRPHRASQPGSLDAPTRPPHRRPGSADGPAGAARPRAGSTPPAHSARCQENNGGADLHLSSPGSSIRWGRSRSRGSLAIRSHASSGPAPGRRAEVESGTPAGTGGEDPSRPESGPSADPSRNVGLRVCERMGWNLRYSGFRMKIPWTRGLKPIRSPEYGVRSTESGIRSSEFVLRNGLFHSPESP